MTELHLVDVVRQLPRGRIQPEAADDVVAAVNQMSVADYRKLLDSVEDAIEARRDQGETVDAVLSGLVIAGAVLRRWLL